MDFHFFCFVGLEAAPVKLGIVEIIRAMRRVIFVDFLVGVGFHVFEIEIFEFFEFDLGERGDLVFGHCLGFSGLGGGLFPPGGESIAQIGGDYKLFLHLFEKKVRIFCYSQSKICGAFRGFFLTRWPNVFR